MALIKQSLAAILCLGMLIACAPKKEGAPTHIWNVTAQNGDKMVGCLAEDVTPDVLGYIDIEALPNFDIKTFEALKIGIEEWEKSGKTVIRSGLANRSKVHHPFGGKSHPQEEKFRHCASYPSPKGATEWYFFQFKYSETTVAYRLFSVGEKMVFIDARTRIAKSKKP